MFLSSGYFKGLNCPYYASGLCERSYCHFRHVKSDSQPKPKQNTVVNINKDEVSQTSGVSDNGVGQKSSLLTMMGSAIKQVQRDIERDTIQIHHLRAESGIGAKSIDESVPSYRPTPIGKIKTKPLAQKKPPSTHNKVTYLPQGIPAYKPTPIHLLEKQKHPSGQSDAEYDPTSNSGLPTSSGPERITLGDAEQRSSVKRSMEPPKYVETKKIKKERRSTSETEIEAKFSSDEESNDEEKDSEEDDDKKRNDKTSETGENATDPKITSGSSDSVTIKKEKIDPGYGENSNRKKGDKHKKKNDSEIVVETNLVNVKKEKEAENSGNVKENTDKEIVKPDGNDSRLSHDLPLDKDKEKYVDDNSNNLKSKERSNDSKNVSKSKEKEKHTDQSKNKGKETTEGSASKKGSVDEKKNSKPEVAEKKDDKSHKSSKHKERRDSSHHSKDKKDSSKQKSSSRTDKDQHKNKRSSHSSSPSRNHRQSSSSKHKKVDRKHKDSSHKSKKDRHRSKDRSKKSKHKKSDKSHSRSSSGRKHKDSKHKKSDKHKHHARHSSSKSSKRRSRHSSVSSDSSLSSSSSSRRSSSRSSSSASSRVSSASPSPQPVKHRNRSSDSKSSQANSRSPRATDKSSKSTKSNRDTKEDAKSHSKSALNAKKPTCISEKPNLFETFQRTITHFDLFGEDSGDSDISKPQTAAKSIKPGEVILLSDDTLSSDDDRDSHRPRNDRNDHSDSGGDRDDHSDPGCDRDDHSDPGCDRDDHSRHDDDEDAHSRDMDFHSNIDENPGIKRRHQDHDEEMEVKFKIPKMAPHREEKSLVTSKKRLAHLANPDAMIKRPTPGRAPPRPSASQMMLNRFKQLQMKQEEEAEEEEEDEEELSDTPDTTETKIQPSICGISSKRVAHVSRISTSNSGNTLKKTKGGKGKKVAAVGKSKEPTQAGTIPKGASRTAHMPSSDVLKRPLIPTESGGKVATNIRQRYLNIFVDECLKIYPQQRDAHHRALLEEKTVYDRASNKNIYLNVAVNMVKKLRDEITKSAEDSDQEMKSPSKNPNAMSHAAILGGAKAVNTKFTMNRTGRLKVPEHLSCRQLFVLISRYILTEEQLAENCFPRPSPDETGHAVIQLPDRVKKLKLPKNTSEKACARCGKRFTVFPDGKYARQESCEYHWGKYWKRRIAGSIESRYTCCEGDMETKGCQLSEYHAYEQNKYEDLSGYAQTLPCSPPPDGNYKLYAMDCEMVYTLGGCELARVTVVDTNLQPVYEAIVRPEYKVIDYNTRFSGMTAADMKGVKTTLQDVQEDLISMFSDRTILIGHSLESDLISLKLLHNTVVDTSVVFPHKIGPPYKRALRTLMAEILQKIIQNADGGHDSKEDAVSCMELMIYKSKEDAKKAMRS